MPLIIRRYSVQDAEGNEKWYGFQPELARDYALCNSLKVVEQVCEVTREVDLANHLPDPNEPPTETMYKAALCTVRVDTKGRDSKGLPKITYVYDHDTENLSLGHPELADIYREESGAAKRIRKFIKDAGGKPITA
jgi:hypothetical protein